VYSWTDGPRRRWLQRAAVGQSYGSSSTTVATAQIFDFKTLF